MERIGLVAGTALAVATVVRLVLLLTPWAYVPDVYYYDQQAVGALLSGMDPYGHHYVVPAYLITPGAENVFAYLPGVLVALVPGVLLGDGRLSLVASDLAIFASLLYLGRPKAKVAAEAFIAFPASVVFSTWYPNNTLVAIALMMGSIALEERGKLKASMILLGLSLGSSQFVWFLLPFLVLKLQGERTLKRLIVALSTATSVILPFLVWNPSAFFYDVVSFQSLRPVQQLFTPEAFGFNLNPTLSGFSLTLFGTEVPLWAKGLIMLLSLLVILRWLGKDFDRYLPAGALFVLTSIFVLANDFSWWYLELPFVLLLAWYVLRDAEPANHPPKP